MNEMNWTNVVIAIAAAAAALAKELTEASSKK